MQQIHRQTLYKALSEPFFAKDVFSKLPIKEFTDDSKILATVINRYYKTNDAPLDENTLLTLVEDRLIKENRPLEEQDRVTSVASSLYQLDFADTNEDTINETIQKYVRGTLTRVAIMDAVQKGAVSEETTINGLIDDLRDILTLDMDGSNGEIIDFFADVEFKKKALANLQQNKYPTGFFSIDSVIDGGLARGEVGLLNAETGGGKALRNGTLIKTPLGDTPIEKLKVGDLVFGVDGKPHKVTGTFPQGKKEEYDVTFSDGVVIPCNDEHIWAYQTKASRGKQPNSWKEGTLRYLMDNVPLQSNGGWNIYIPMCEPVEYKEKRLPLLPYLVGVLLGDGGLSQRQVSFTNSEADIVSKVKGCLAFYNLRLSTQQKAHNYRVIKDTTSSLPNYLTTTLAQLGLNEIKSVNKFIPREYLEGSVKQRLELLQGLIDTDGYTRGSSYNYYTISPQLANDVAELVRSLGMTAAIRVKKKPKYVYNSEIKEGQDCYVLSIKTTERIPKIHTSKKHELNWRQGQAWARRTIRSIVKTNRQVEMTCISIDSEDKLYLTEGYVVTHNTSIAVNLARNYVRQGLNVLYVPLEEKVDRMLIRFEQLMSQVGKRQLLPDGEIDPALYDVIQEAYARAKSEDSNQPWGNLWIRKYKPQELTPNGFSQLISDVMIRKGQRVDIVILDYPDLMRNPHISSLGESEAGGKLYEDLRATAQEYDFVLWTLSQLNRGGYAQDVKRADSIEGSKRKMNAVEFVGTLNQKPEEFREGFLRVYLDKVRNNSGVAFDRMIYLKVEPATVTIRDETAEERYAHLELLNQDQSEGNDSYKKQNTHTPQQAKEKTDGINSQLLGVS